jgi:hypothetical protein
MQTLFVREYMVDLNATSAAVRAGYSARNADKIGPMLLGKVRIATAIAAALKERVERVELTADEIIAGLRREAARTGVGSMHSARVKALETLARMGGFLPEFHFHKHHHNSQPARPEQIGLSSQEVVDRLPLDVRIAVLETIRQVRKEMEEKAIQQTIPKLTASPETAAPGDVITTTSAPAAPAIPPGPSPGPSA